MTQLWKSALLTLLVGGAAWFAPFARADEWDKQTVLTFNEPVEVPGKILPAGTYVLRLGSAAAGRDYHYHGLRNISVHRRYGRDCQPQ